MSELLTQLREEFQDEDVRYAYVEAHLNASVAAQIKKFRGKDSQEELAVKIGTKQSGISRLENANYSSWKVETLRKLARAFGLRLKISFEEFGTLLPEIANFKTGVLNKRPFASDPVFNPSRNETRIKKRPAASEEFLRSIRNLDGSQLDGKQELGNQIQSATAPEGGSESRNAPDLEQGTKASLLPPLSIEDAREHLRRGRQISSRRSGGRRHVRRR